MTTNLRIVPIAVVIRCKVAVTRDGARQGAWNSTVTPVPGTFRFAIRYSST